MAQIKRMPVWLYAVRPQAWDRLQVAVGGPRERVGQRWSQAIVSTQLSPRVNRTYTYTQGRLVDLRSRENLSSAPVLCTYVHDHLNVGGVPPSTTVCLGGATSSVGLIGHLQALHYNPGGIAELDSGAKGRPLASQAGSSRAGLPFCILRCSWCRIPLPLSCS
jgi:hypothetical protein